MIDFFEHEWHEFDECLFNQLINWWNIFRDIRDIRVQTISLNTNGTNLANDFVIFVNGLNEIELMIDFFEHEWHGFDE